MPFESTLEIDNNTAETLDNEDDSHDLITLELDNNTAEPLDNEDHNHDLNCTSLRADLKEWLHAGTGYDVIINVRNRTFKAHRAILKARSPLFKSLLQDNPEILHVDDPSPEAFGQLLEYIYCGHSTNVTLSNAFELYEAADRFGLPVLKRKCVRVLKTSMTVKAVCDIVRLASRYDEKRLMSKAARFFAGNLLEVVKSDEWIQFLKSDPVQANKVLTTGLEIAQVKR